LSILRKSYERIRTALLQTTGAAAMTKTIVFIHGNFVNNRCWDGWVARYRARGFNCLAIAYPGRDKPVDWLKANADGKLLGSLTLAQVADYHATVIRSLDEKPIVIGHSFGGLLTQLMVQRGVAAAAVAIDSVPPQGVIVPSWSFIRSTWPVLNPFVSASRPYLMPFRHWQYTFTNGLPLAEQRASYDVYVVPESRPLARGGLSSAARINFKRLHAPLLLIGGEKDNIMPAKLNRANYRRYQQSGSITEYKEFAGRTHYTVIGGQGWEEVADYALDWTTRMTTGRELLGTQGLSANKDPGMSTHVPVETRLR
jgi:pimeloyl-ACP methyl ester carboxylesterase